ncbi:acetyl-CoA acetyltransferase [Sulfolobus acidocaldarius SUSAZ]|nr:acetyl-CoA acetyltransferase [Sulfolobus acidocaldarius SUSAZ]
MISGFSSKLFKTYEGSVFDLISLATREALDMAKLEIGDVDGFAMTFFPGLFDGKGYLFFPLHQITHYLGIKARYMDLVEFGGPSILAMIYRAEKAIRAGEAQNVLCIAGGIASFIREKGPYNNVISKLYPYITSNTFEDFYEVYDKMDPITHYALVADRHKRLFGTTDEQRALLVVKQRKNGLNNPRALFKNQITVDDVISSPVVADPLHLFEVVYPIDGFHAFIVSRKNKELRPVEILNYGEMHWPSVPAEWDMDITYTPTIQSVKIANVDLNKIDAFQLYDATSIGVLTQIEDLGLVEKGKAGKFIEENDIYYQGNIPMNTGGGALSQGQPAYMSGPLMLEEALLQLNYMAQGRQVKDVSKVLINGVGGGLAGRNDAITIVLGEKK